MWGLFGPFEIPFNIFFCWVRGDGINYCESLLGVIIGTPPVKKGWIFLHIEKVKLRNMSVQLYYFFTSVVISIILIKLKKKIVTKVYQWNHLKSKTPSNQPPSKKKKKKIHQSFLPKISQLVNSRPPTLILRTIAPIHCLRSQLPTASQITHQHFGFSTSRSDHCSQSHTSRIGWGMFIDLPSLIWYLSLLYVLWQRLGAFFNFH